MPNVTAVSAAAVQDRVKDLETQKGQGELHRMMQASMGGIAGSSAVPNPFGTFGDRPLLSAPLFPSTSVVQVEFTARLPLAAYWHA